MDRRKFCKTGLSTALALGIPGYLAGCSKSNPVLPPSNGITARAAAITGDNLGAMTRDAIDALGGMNSILNQGDTVFIKPNFVTVPWANTNDCFHAGECTKPEIILAVTEECLKAGAGEVFVGEGSHLPSFDWKYAVTLDGSTNLVMESARLSSLYHGKVTLACLETDSPDWIDISSVTSLIKLPFPALLPMQIKSFPFLWPRPIHGPSLHWLQRITLGLHPYPVMPS